MESAHRRNLMGISGISAAVLMLEISLTRVFSATMWYHFAFMSISLALLGGAVAGVFVYLFPRRLPPTTLRRQLAWFTLLFSIATALCFILFLRIPFHVELLRPPLQPQAVLRLALIYLDLAVPFFLGGVGITLALSRWGDQIGRVYFADLLGAGLGCLLSIVALDQLGGPGAVLGAGAIAGLAALHFASGRQRYLTFGWLLVLALLLVFREQVSFLRIVSTKAGDIDQERIFESWNSFSRVTVHEHWTPFPFGWGMSPIHQEPDPGHRLLLIDSAAGTPIQRFNGDLTTVQFLRDDITSFAYYLLDQPKVLIIGPGGGRDMLTALGFGARQVTGVELNPAIVQAVRNDFGEYAGHVYDQPGVQIFVDDARRFIAGSRERYDLIQASVIDTWAATTAGAFALSENSLYTREAFQSYYRHLTPDGLLSVSRWYLSDQPAETLRLVLLGMEAWAQEGVAQPAEHVLVALNPKNWMASEAMATVLLKRSPFTPQEVALARREAQRLGFTLAYAPGSPEDVREPPPLPGHGRGAGESNDDNPVSQAILAADRQAFIRAYPLDISPPTDDRPFFFALARLGHLLNRRWDASMVYQKSVEALNVLTLLLGITAVAAGLFVLVPLVVTRSRERGSAARARWLAYFAALGLAFMLIEIPVVQRMTLYLGHPAYALAVVLFSLLVFSGLGSLSTHPVPREAARATLGRRFPPLLTLTLLQAYVAPLLLGWTQAWPLGLRIATSVILLAPLGFLMGMPFPLGWKWVASAGAAARPWLWGINGALSVVGSVLAALVAIQFGFRVTMLLGMLAYSLAWAVTCWQAGRPALE
jgi:SAM-dependent methyltransferase